MNGTIASAQQKLRDGKDSFAKAGNNQSMLKDALIFIKAALDDYVDASPPSTSTGSSGYRMQAGKETTRPLFRKLDQLQDDHIINAEDRKYISDMLRARNKVAHGERHTILRDDIKRYVAVVQKIIDQDSLYKRMAGGNKKRNSDQSRTVHQKATSTRPSSVLPVPRQPVASPPIIKFSPAATPQPASSQAPVEVGGTEPARPITENTSPSPDSSPKTETAEELLRRLLSL
jgi:hypothetical protein